MIDLDQRLEHWAVTHRTEPFDSIFISLSRVGSYETGFVENDGNQAFWWLPNVVGVAPR